MGDEPLGIGTTKAGLCLLWPVIVGAKGLRPQRASPDDDRPTKAGEKPGVGRVKAGEGAGRGSRQRAGQMAGGVRPPVLPGSGGTCGLLIACLRTTLSRSASGGQCT